jgi:peptidoglycan/LPS O-acetylase OafA/YrhL
LYREIIVSRFALAATRLIVCLTAIAWAVSFFVIMSGLDIVSLSIASAPVIGRLDPVFHWFMQKAGIAWPTIVMFPLMILSLALIETRRGHFGKRLSALGDASYASYMLHYPLLLIFSLVMARLKVDESVRCSAWCLALFFAVLIAMSLCSFRYLETPAQRLLRGSQKSS